MRIQMTSTIVVAVGDVRLLRHGLDMPIDEIVFGDFSSPLLKGRLEVS
jgi:hypothetical protein